MGTVLEIRPTWVAAILDRLRSGCQTPISEVARQARVRRSPAFLRGDDQGVPYRRWMLAVTLEQSS